MNQNTYIQSILHYFSTMDIASLQLHLKEDAYSDVTKEDFLNEVEKIFEDHRNSGDSELLIFKGACAGEECESCGKKGFRFVGNHSKDYLDLIFETEGDYIKEIYDCPYFKSDEDIKGISSKASICFNEDDRVSFKRTPDYWFKVDSASAAYNEIITKPPKPVTFEELCNWVDKHSFTDELIGSYDVFNPRMRWTPFSTLYNGFKKIRIYISNYLNEIEYVNSFISQITTEQELIDWIVRNNALYEALPYELLSSFKKKNKIYFLIMPHQIELKGKQFSKTYKFVHFYSKNHNELIAKYNTYTAKEESELYNNYKSGDDDIFSLRFHLEKRKALEAQGITLPFFINQEKMPF